MKSKVDNIKYLQNDKMFEYLVDMIFTQNYASLNRKIIVREISEFLDVQYNHKNNIETIHNYIDS